MDENKEKTSVETTAEVINEAPQDLINDEIEESVKIISPMKMVLKRFFRSKLSVIGLVVIIFMFLFVYIGPMLSAWDAIAIDEHGSVSVSSNPITFEDPSNPGSTITVYQIEEYEGKVNKFASPFTIGDGNRMHIFGTDSYGMDVFTRLMKGGRVSITLAFLVVIVETFLGVVLGGLSGYIGKWVDMLIMRIIDVINCVPTLPLLLIISAILQGWKVPDTMRIYYLMGFLSLISWTGTCRIVRGQILMLREQEYMVAAEALGMSTARKIFKHLLPNVMPQLIVNMTLSLGSMILYDATLGYLDLGVPLPYPSWGKMINSATDPAVLANYWWCWVPPGICIILTVLAFNFVGDGLRDALDPRMKR